MHEFIYFNDQICRAADAFLPAVSAAALYGRGIFTTIAVRESKPFLWEKHWRRLQNNADKLNVDLSAFSEQSIKSALFEVIRKNKIEDARVRLTFFDEHAGKIWNFEFSRQTSLLITAADFRAVSETFRLTVSPFAVNSNSPLAGVKSCNYAENLLAFEAAKKDGFDEALRLNERGEIAAACLANIFWLKNERLFTPALETGCLGGTTREFLTENCQYMEVRENLESISHADAIFLTSAGIGIVQIGEFGGRKFERNFDQITKIIENGKR